MTSLARNYHDILSKLLERIVEEEAEAMEEAAKILADAIADGQRIFAFGSGHSSFSVQDMAYRAGGLILINPLLGPGLSAFDQRPVTLSSQLERLEGYAKILMNNAPIESGDVLIVASVSGRNAVPIEMAMQARERGVKVIAVTSRAYIDAVESRHSTGKKLHDHADVVLDNKVPPGDALLEADGIPQKFCAPSGVTSIAVLQMLVAATVEELLRRGIEPPILRSANVEGGGEYNARLIKQYADRIFYL
jgi:uncharacterized phosphosugar-binding protein